MNKGLVLLALAAGLSVGGCATVLNGTNIEYEAKTDPSGADIVFLNGPECQSPCEVELKRKSDTRVDIAKEGYQPVYVLVQSRLAGSTFGNILLGGGIGAAVDGTNGASNRLFPRPLYVKLVPEGSDGEAALLDKNGDFLMTVQQHNNEVRDDVAKTIGVEHAIDKNMQADTAASE